MQNNERVREQHSTDRKRQNEVKREGRGRESI